MLTAFSQPGRAIPTFRSAGHVFGPSPPDVAVGAYRTARDACDYTVPLAAAYAALARANRVRPENRRTARATAFRQINALRAQRRLAWDRRDRAVVALYVAGGNSEIVDALDFTPVVAAAFAGVSLADDPDMAGAGWVQ